MEYLFRGKAKLGGEWVYGYYVCLGGVNFIYTGYVDTDYGEDVPEMYEVIRKTVGQDTGLTDRDNTKIFDGDILESRASENKEDWKRWIVAFRDGSFCFEREIPRKHKHKHEQNLLCEDEVKLYGLMVIGNIHDNPELLEEQEHE